MKTAISIPDDVFAQAEHLARSKGVTRSELYTKALHFYIQHKVAVEAEKEDAINELVAELGEDAFSLNHVSRAQLDDLQDEGW